MLAGIGTILTPDQARESATAGAAFGVAPGFNPHVVDAAQQAGLPFSPGVCTPSDVEAAVERGCRTLKFFPAEPCGGLSYLKSIAAPFAHLGLRFIPSWWREHGQFGSLSQRRSGAGGGRIVACAPRIDYHERLDRNSPKSRSGAPEY